MGFNLESELNRPSPKNHCVHLGPAGVSEFEHIESYLSIGHLNLSRSKINIAIAISFYET